MKPLKYKVVIKILEENNFYLSRQSGYHMIYKNKDNIIVPIPMHGKNKEIPIGTLLSIIKQTDLSKSLFNKK